MPDDNDDESDDRPAGYIRIVPEDTPLSLPEEAAAFRGFRRRGVRRLNPFPPSWSVRNMPDGVEAYTCPDGGITVRSEDGARWSVTYTPYFYPLSPRLFELSGTYQDARRHAICLARKLDARRSRFSPDILRKHGYKSIRSFARQKYDECLRKFGLRAVRSRPVRYEELV